MGGGKQGEKGTGGVREAGVKDSHGGGKREKKGKITQHCALFRNKKI